MTEADKVVAAAADKIVTAIFAASMCTGKQDHAIYLQTYHAYPV
jgi:hypothetical protein